MTQSLISRFATALCAASLIFLAPAATAALRAYEGFSYPAGDSLTNSSAQGSGDSFGWASRWGGANTPLTTDAAASLTYADPLGNVLVTDGGSVVIGAPAGTTANAQPSRSFNFGTLTNTAYSGLHGPGTYWASFIMQWIGPLTAGSTTNKYVRKGDLVFRSSATTNASSTGTALFSIGSPNAVNRLGTPVDTWTAWSGSDAGAGTQNTGLAACSAALSAPTFVLLRIDLDGTTANDTVYAWLNWTNLASEPPIALASLTNNTVNDDGLNNIRFDANGGNAAGTNTALAVDEFRLGDTFADVTPYVGGSTQSPNITVQPADVITTATYPATFSLTVTGTDPLYYQWFFNTNTALAGQTNASMTIASVDPTNAGPYLCIVSNAGGSATSQVATLTVLAPVLPSIPNQPQDFTGPIGFPASFSVGATGSAPLQYQWYFNQTTPLLAQTNPVCFFTVAQSNQAGGYSVIVSNKFSSTTSSVATLTIGPLGRGQLPGFSGADGAGKYAHGGRGGDVYHVTLLDKNYSDNRPGTLRYGLNTGGTNRTIVFDVAGVFWLGKYGAESNHDNAWDASSSRYTIPANITIAGQTAPGPVYVMGGEFHTSPSSTNVLIRNVSFAPGYGLSGFYDPATNGTPTPGTLPLSFTFDAMDVEGLNFMVDHCSTFYTTDEAISCNEAAANLTIQYCDCSQGQNYNGHAYGHLLQAGSNAKISFLNNLDAHQTTRLPRVGSEVGTGAWNDFRNNVIYNWLPYAGYTVEPQPSFNNFIQNFYIYGPGGDTSTTNTGPGGSLLFYGTDPAICRVFADSNRKNTTRNGDLSTDLPTTISTTNSGNDYIDVTPLPAALDVDIGLTLTARQALTNVLRFVGARWWERGYDFRLNNTNAISTIDERIIHETYTGTGRIMAWADDPFNSDPNEGTEWRSLLAWRADITTGAAPFNRPAGWDTDGDGMPDYWETEHGLNPNDPSDANGDYDNDGYSNLEKYLNEIAAWPAPDIMYFTGLNNSRYAELFNWQVNGVPVVITNRGTVATYSFWQPSKYDTAVISNKTVLVDSVGQHAGSLFLTNGSTLRITNGWLEAANQLQIGPGCTNIVSLTGALTVTSNLVNNGVLRLSGSATLTVPGTFTNNGILDIMAWRGTLPSGFVNHGTVLDHSLVRLNLPSLNGADSHLSIQGYIGHTYLLQSCVDLAAGQWQSIGSPVPGVGALIPFTDTGAAAAHQKFYRVIIDP